MDPHGAPHGAPADMRDEPPLVAGLVAGDIATVRAFLENTHGPVHRMAARLTHDPDARRDWSHATLLGILDDLRAGRFVYRRPGSFWAWFRKRAYFRLLDECRRARRRAGRERALDAAADGDGAPGGSDPADPGAPDPAAELERVELRAAIERCLEGIAHPEQRRATALVLEELAYEEIAAALGAPLNTVRTWIRRGRIALRRCLMERWGIAAPGEAGG